MAPTIVHTGTLDLTGAAEGFSRADLEFHEVDHAGVSYAAHVFLDNPRADAATPQDEAHGYAGAFHVFGHGGCFGEVGHCEIRHRSAFDPRGAHPLTPARKVLIATEAVRRAVTSGAREVAVTVVPVITGTTVQTGEEVSEVCRFDHLKLVTYR